MRHWIGSKFSETAINLFVLCRFLMLTYITFNVRERKRDILLHPFCCQLSNSVVKLSCVHITAGVRIRFIVK